MLTLKFVSIEGHLAGSVFGHVTLPHIEYGDYLKKEKRKKTKKTLGHLAGSVERLCNSRSWGCGLEPYLGCRLVFFFWERVSLHLGGGRSFRASGQCQITVIKAGTGLGPKTRPVENMPLMEIRDTARWKSSVGNKHTNKTSSNPVCQVLGKAPGGHKCLFMLSKNLQASWEDKSFTPPPERIWSRASVPDARGINHCEAGSLGEV